MMVYGVVGVLGAVFGSFLNVLIYRLSKGQSPFGGRSKCPSCKKQISWQHNIPLISFFWLRGKCASCHKKISWHYPLVELLTTSLFLWWYLIGMNFFRLEGNYLDIVQPVFWLVMGMLLMVVFFADLWFGVIPDLINLLVLGLALVYRIALVTMGQMKLIDFELAIIAGLVLYLIFYLLVYITKGKGFGLGDVKLAPGLGLLLGWQKTIILWFVSFILGSLVALVLLALRKKSLKQTIPFGPFLVIGTGIALVWGDKIWLWYMGLLGI
jgi:prepilin signal peptidase PulO-like enzyme (type II secretory pathway)